MTDSPPPELRPRRGARRLLLALLVIAAAGGFAWWQWFATYHLVVVDPGKLYRDGNRSVREFKNTLRKTNPRTIVVIADEEEYDEPEFTESRRIAERRGIEYHWIPVMAGAYPTAEDVRKFLAVAADTSKQPVLFHDDEGIRRAGMMMAAYQETVMGYDDARAKATIRAFGHSDRTIGDVMAFIDAYDPTAGLTTDLNLVRPSPARRAKTAPATTTAAADGH